MTMKNISIGVFFLFGMLQTQAQETKTLWQKDIPSSTQDFLTTSSSTIDSKSCFQQTLLIQNLNRFQQAISKTVKVMKDDGALIVAYSTSEKTENKTAEHLASDPVSSTNIN